MRWGQVNIGGVHIFVAKYLNVTNPLSVCIYLILFIQIHSNFFVYIISTFCAIIIFMLGLGIV